VDGVLRDFIHSLVFTYRKYYPQDKIIEPINSFSLKDFFPIKEEIIAFFLKHAREVFLENAPMIKDANRGLKYLRRLGYEIIITTSQKEEALQPTLDWLNKFKVKPDKIFNTKDKYLVDFDVHIDDDPYQIESIVNANKRVIIFSTLQNKKIKPEIEKKCIRVKNWIELIELFEDYSKIEDHIKNFTSFPT